MPRRRPARLSGPAIPTRARPEIPAFIDSAFVRPRSEMSDADAKRQMASDMRESAYRAGGVSRDDLIRLGYTADQVERLGAAAAQAAQAAAGATCMVA